MLTDPITNTRINTAHPAMRTHLINAVNECNQALTGRAMLRLAYVERSDLVQRALFSQGRNNLTVTNKLRRLAKLPNITEKENRKVVTNAKEWESFHNFGLATDIVLIIDGKQVSYDMAADMDGDGFSDWMECVAIFKKHGFKWGGDWTRFKDYPHFEMTFGYTVKQLNALRLAGKLTNGFVNIKTN